MTLHITVRGVLTLCGDPGAALNLEQLIRFHPLTYWAMRIFGCRYCGSELRDALRHARPIQ